MRATTGGYVCALIACLFSATAHANLVFTIDPSVGSTGDTGSAARMTMSFESLADENLLAIEIENTTPVEFGATLTAVGFELPSLPATSWSFAPDGEGSYFDVLSFGVAVHPPWLDAPGGYDVVLTSDGNFIGGSPVGGIAAGDSQSVVLSLGSTGLSALQLADDFADYYASLELNYVVSRFQQVGPGEEESDVVAGLIDDASLPEPGTISLLALGGMGMLARRRRR